MDHCKDCKFWEADADGENGVCKRDGSPGCLYLASGPSPQNETGYLLTEPLFGCVQFEAK